MGVFRTAWFGAPPCLFFSAILQKTIFLTTGKKKLSFSCQKSIPSCYNNRNTPQKAVTSSLHFGSNLNGMNTQSFEQKYLQLTPRLYSVAFSVLGNAEDAEDAVQETFARLWEKRNELERMENAEGYFMTTLRHISLNMLRNRRAAADIAEAHNAPTDIDATTAQAEMEHRETHGLLKRLLARLSPRSRRVVALRHVGECSFHDMAEITGETEVNLRMILSRARRQLRAAYEEEMKHG